MAALTDAIFKNGGNISDAQQFDDPIAKRFFSRTVFSVEMRSEPQLREMLGFVATRYNIAWKLADANYRPKVLILASQTDHCLGELLYRRNAGELQMDIVGVASNHPEVTYRNVLTSQLPFFYVPVTGETRARQEDDILRIIDETKAELIVLARYMQILSNTLADTLSGRCINIHHSFLPGFKGAKPYQQAYDRGVKIIGATAHYVTSDLDEGPIIEQEVERISHRDGPMDLVRRGREIERRVLARAVRYHLEDRVVLSGHRTVVFAD